jgi:hypothetical protein
MYDCTKNLPINTLHRKLGVESPYTRPAAVKLMFQSSLVFLYTRHHLRNYMKALMGINYIPSTPFISLYPGEDNTLCNDAVELIL